MSVNFTMNISVPFASYLSIINVFHGGGQVVSWQRCLGFFSFLPFFLSLLPSLPLFLSFLFPEALVCIFFPLNNLILVTRLTYLTKE